MILINRKTGEIVGFSEGIIRLSDIGCKNVAEMYEAGWVEYEEPKERHYYIEPRGQVVALEFGDDIDDLKEELSDLGNYFETKEEAEKAVEKLKAWKQLKDAGFKFDHIEGTSDLPPEHYRLIVKIPRGMMDCAEYLIGGEEWVEN